MPCSRSYVRHHLKHPGSSNTLTIGHSHGGWSRGDVLVHGMTLQAISALGSIDSIGAAVGNACMAVHRTIHTLPNDGMTILQLLFLLLLDRLTVDSVSSVTGINVRI